MNVISLIYVSRVRPFILRSQNRLEIFNEFSLGMGISMNANFTNLCPDKWLQYQVGWAVIILFLVTITINIYMANKHMFMILFLIAKRKYNFRKMNKKKREMLEYMH